MRDELVGSSESDDMTRAIGTLAEVNVAFHLSESLRETGRRRWWDVLTMRMALRSGAAYPIVHVLVGQNG